MLTDRWALVEADFDRYYRLDLRAAVFGAEHERMGVRRLLARIDGLPPESAVGRDGKAWTRQDELAATAVERAELHFGITAQMWGAKAKDLPPLVSFQHPDRKAAAAAPKNVSSDPAVIRQFFGIT